MGKSTISMAIFNSYIKLPEGSLTGLMTLMTRIYFGVPLSSFLRNLHLSMQKADVVFFQVYVENEQIRIDLGMFFSGRFWAN